MNFKLPHRTKFSIALFVSLISMGFLAPLLCNDRPFLMEFEGKFYFPFFKYYPAENFGDETRLHPDYKAVAKKAHWSIFPLIPFGENESMKSLGGPPPTPPDKQNWLGTDDRGRDVLTRILYGLRHSMSFAICSWVGIVSLAILFGLLPGFRGGAHDFIVQRLIEIWQTLPGVYVILLLVGIFSGSFSLLVLTWTLLGWMPLASLLRAEGIRLRSQPYIEAARTMGVPSLTLFMRHVIPNTLTPILSITPFIIAHAIAGISAFDFLGLGLPPPTASWGELLRQGKENFSSWWLMVFPLLSLFSILLLLMQMGESFREVFQRKKSFL